MPPVEFWKTTGGKTCREEFLSGSLPPKTERVVDAAIDLLKRYGHTHLMKTKDVKDLKKGLYELRTRGRGVAIRIFFGFRNLIYPVVLIVIKKKQRIPQEMEKARKRLSTFDE